MRDHKKVVGTQIGFDVDTTPIQHVLCVEKWEKMKELWKSGKIAKIILGKIVVFEEGSKNWSCIMTHKPNYLKQYRGTNLNLTICAPFHVFLGIVEVIICLKII